MDKLIGNYLRTFLSLVGGGLVFYLSLSCTLGYFCFLEYGRSSLLIWISLCFAIYISIVIVYAINLTNYLYEVYWK